MSQVEANLAIPAYNASVAVSSLQSNTKPHTQNQDLHDHAVKLLVEIDASGKRSSDYNKRRREATEKLRPVLKKIWEAFDNGETVGACTGKKEWCKQVQSITYRRCLQIINGESQTKQVKSLHLKEGTLVTVSGVRYRIASDMVHRSKEAVGGIYNFTFRAAPDGIEEPATPEPSDLVAHVNDKRHDIYIGRKNVRGKHKFPASIWGNTTGSLDKYEEYVRSSPELLHQLASLKGKVLGCWHTVADRRKGSVCHGDVLLKLIEEYDGKRLPPIPAVKSYADGAVTVQANWYTPDETRALFETCAQLDFVRGKAPFGKEKRHAVRIFCDVESAVRETKARSPLSEAPDAINKLLADLRKHSGKNVNYAAVVEYRDGDDYIAPHQHSEDRGNDATVWIVSTGAERPFAVKPVNGGAATRFLATLGSLITLSSEANETHVHYVPKCKRSTGVRYSVNCKAIPLDPVKATEQIAVNAREDSDQSSLPATRDWIHIPQFLSQQEADSLYAAVGEFPWLLADEDKDSVHFGKSYAARDKSRTEHPINPLLLPLADLVATVAHKQSNYIQCHRMNPDAIVRPHRDPAGIHSGNETLCRRRQWLIVLRDALHPWFRRRVLNGASSPHHPYPASSR
jgi:alkylated DNA repair dioxygenase AlkB